MPTYILLSTLTPEGRRTLHSDPDRMEQVNQEITDFGCRVVAQYAVLGALRLCHHRRSRRQRDDRPPVSRPGLARHDQCYDAPCDSDFGTAGKVERVEADGRSARA